MGYASRRENVLLCVSALESVLADMGAPVTQGAALPATMEAFANDRLPGALRDTVR